MDSAHRLIQIICSPRPAPPPRQNSGFVADSEFKMQGSFAAPSFHYTVRSRSFQPSPVEGVPPRSPNLDFGRCVQRAERQTPPQKVEIISQQKTSMTYIQQFETELTQKLDNGTDNTLAIVRWASEKVLESYRNGITAGQKGTQVIRKGQSRRRFPQQAQ